jgi:hypothetical protein
LRDTFVAFRFSTMSRSAAARGARPTFMPFANAYFFGSAVMVVPSVDRNLLLAAYEIETEAEALS